MYHTNSWTYRNIDRNLIYIYEYSNYGLNVLVTTEGNVAGPDIVYFLIIRPYFLLVFKTY